MKKKPSPRRAGRSSGYLCFAGCLRAVLLLLLLPGLALCKEEMPMVSGKVVDATTKKGLPFADILVQETRYRTSANIDGDFRIPLPPSGSELQVSYVGYKTAALRAQPGQSPVTVRLTPVGYVTEAVNVVGKKVTEGMQGSYRLGSAEIKNFAGITRDPMRALQMMPGVSTNDAASAKMDVRGGTWDENTVLIDGAEIEDPYHLKEISLASISIFNEDMVKDMYFSSGGFGVKYGDALSSVTSIHYKEGNRKLLEGNLNLSPLDFNACIQGPINNRSSFIVAARGSYLGYMLKNLGINQDVYGGYYDIQGDIGYHLSDLSNLRIDFLYSKDLETQSPIDYTGVYPYSGTIDGKPTEISRQYDSWDSFSGDYSTSFVSAILNNTASADLSTRTLVYYTRDLEYQAPLESENFQWRFDSFPQYWTRATLLEGQAYSLNIATLAAKQTADWAASSFLNLKAGFTAKSISYDFVPHIGGTEIFSTNASHFPDTTTTYIAYVNALYDSTTILAHTFALAGYVQQEYHLENDFSLTLGARADYFNMDKELRFSPRVRLRYRLPLDLDMTAAWGRYYQLPGYQQLRTGVESAENTPMQEATQYVLGFEKEFGNGAKAELQVYRKDYGDLVPMVTTALGHTYYYNNGEVAGGYAYGADLLCSADLGPLELSLSYSYLVAMERIAGANEYYYPRASDQTNTASFSAISDLGAGWTLSVRGFYGSGYAYTPDVTKLDTTMMISTWVLGSNNSAHYPPYERVDFNLSKTFKLMNSPLNVFLDITNLLNRKNVWSYMYTYNGQGNPIIKPYLLLGIIPAIGVSYKFGG